jgi:hypothetical protein
MIQTVHCPRCGRALDAFVDVAAGIPMGLTHQAIQTKVQTAQIRHADSCPARQLLTSPPTDRRSSAPAARAGSSSLMARLLGRAGRRLRRLAL